MFHQIPSFFCVFSSSFITFHHFCLVASHFRYILSFSFVVMFYHLQAFSLAFTILMHFHNVSSVYTCLISLCNVSLCPFSFRDFVLILFIILDFVYTWFLISSVFIDFSISKICKGSMLRFKKVVGSVASYHCQIKNVGRKHL